MERRIIYDDILDYNPKIRLVENFLIGSLRYAAPMYKPHPGFRSP